MTIVQPTIVPIWCWWLFEDGSAHSGMMASESEAKAREAILKVYPGAQHMQLARHETLISVRVADEEAVTISVRKLRALLERMAYERDLREMDCRTMSE